MSVTQLSGQIARLQRTIADLDRKSSKARLDASKQRESALRTQRGIPSGASESLTNQRLRRVETLNQKASSLDSKAADIEKQSSRKSEELRKVELRLAKAQADERKRTAADREKERQKELQEIVQLEARRDELRLWPKLEPRGDRMTFGRQDASPTSPQAGNPEANQSEALAWDVCLSFAGEQRSYVELVANSLKNQGYAVFYDEHEQARIWGKNQVEYFDYIYRVASRVCLMFISVEYRDKLWTRHERKSALSRALRDDEYVLPIRFDSTQLDGLNPDIGYIDASGASPDSIASLLMQKLGPPLSEPA